MLNPDFFISVSKQALLMSLYLSAPTVLGALVVGLIVSILQATTQIQEQTLTFVPKLLVVSAALFFMGPQILQQMLMFTGELFKGMAQLLQ